jgi:hypothetical protein
MATTRTALEKRVRKLALERGLCPTHPRERLWCACDYEWTGTDEQWAAVEQLLAPLKPYDRAMVPIAAACPWYHAPRYCHACINRAFREVDAPKDPMSDEDWQRLTELAALLKRKDPEDASIRLRWEQQPLFTAYVPEPQAPRPEELLSDNNSSPPPSTNGQVTFIERTPPDPPSSHVETRSPSPPTAEQGAETDTDL